MAELIPPVPNDPNTGFILRNWLLKVRTNINKFAADIAAILVDLTNVISTSNPLTVANIASYVNTNTISNNYVANATLTGAKIANATITDANIANATITNASIANTTITAAKIANATITTTQIANATITDANIASLNADKITAGAIRGINVNASSHTTKGSYLTSATSGGDTTVNVKDTTDFPSSGTAVVFDTTNDRDSFTFTGKTSTTLTGCSGVLSHNNSATVIPLLKTIVIDGPINEMRFYGDRGDGTIEELASIGITTVGSDTIVGNFGTSNTGNSRIALLGSSDSNVGIQGQSISSSGVVASSSSGSGLTAASTTGFGMSVIANTTKGHALFSPLIGRPSNRQSGTLAVINTTGGSADSRLATPKLMIADGTDWRLVEDYTIWTG